MLDGRGAVLQMQRIVIQADQVLRIEPTWALTPRTPAQPHGDA